MKGLVTWCNGHDIFVEEFTEKTRMGGGCFGGRYVVDLTRKVSCFV